MIPSFTTFAPYHTVFKHTELLNSYSDVQTAQRTWRIHSCSQSRVKSLACTAKFYGSARFITIIFWLPPSCDSVKPCDRTFLKVWSWDPFHWNEPGEHRMKRQIPGTDFRWWGHWAWKSELLSPVFLMYVKAWEALFAALFISLCRDFLFSASDRAKNFNVNNKLKPLSHQRKTSHWWQPTTIWKLNG